MEKETFGQTVTYRDIAKQINKPNTVRAVVAAIGTNLVLIIIPRHLVVAKELKLTGYRGGLEMKGQLLTLEQYYKEE